MYQLIFLISITFIYTVTLLLASQTRSYFLFLNLSCVPILISGYFFSTFSTILLTVFSCILATTLLHGGVSTSTVMQAVGLFILTAFSSTVIRASCGRFKSKEEDNIKSSKDDLKNSEANAEKLSNSKISLENKTSTISDLYYSVKAMGSCFTFNGLLNTLRDALIESFEFKACKLITLYESGEEIKIDKIYQINKERVEQAEASGYEEGLVRVMLRKKQVLPIDIREGKADAEEFVFPENLQTFISMPIISADKTNAVLAAEDIDLEQEDQFVVLANQFSMALERIRLYELVQELAITDGLTGAFVRRHFTERLNEELARADNFNTRVSVLMIDVDDFKEYNDRYGHLKGDILLKKIADALKENIRDIDIMGRYGGEEFCITLPDTGLKGAEYVANRLRESVKAFSSTISIGVATYPDEAKDSAHLMEKSDRMLYKAKGSGKDKVCIDEK